MTQQSREPERREEGNPPESRQSERREGATAPHRSRAPSWNFIGALLLGIVLFAGGILVAYGYQRFFGGETEVTTTSASRAPGTPVQQQPATNSDGSQLPSTQGTAVNGVHTTPPASSLNTMYQPAQGTQPPQQLIQTPQGDWRVIPVARPDGLIATSPGTTQEYTNMPAMAYRPYPNDNGQPQWQLGTDRPYIPAYVTLDPNRAKDGYFPDTVQDQHGNKHHVLVAQPVQRPSPELTKALVPAESQANGEAAPAPTAEDAGTEDNGAADAPATPKPEAEQPDSAPPAEPKNGSGQPLPAEGEQPTPAAPPEPEASDITQRS